MNEFAPVRYKSDGGYCRSSVLILLAALCATGVALGVLASLIGQFFYMILLFPLVIGSILVLVDVKAEEVDTNEKGEIEKTQLVQMTYPGSALAAFEKALAEKCDAPAPSPEPSPKPEQAAGAAEKPVEKVSGPCQDPLMGNVWL